MQNSSIEGFHSLNSDEFTQEPEHQTAFLLEGNDYINPIDMFCSIRDKIGEMALSDKPLIFIGYDGSKDQELSRTGAYGVTLSEFEDAATTLGSGENPIIRAGVSKHRARYKHPTIGVLDSSLLQQIPKEQFYVTISDSSTIGSSLLAKFKIITREEQNKFYFG